jgi:hypothetical protein
VGTTKHLAMAHDAVSRRRTAWKWDKNESKQFSEERQTSLVRRRARTSGLQPLFYSGLSMLMLLLIFGLNAWWYNPQLEEIMFEGPSKKYRGPRSPKQTEAMMMPRTNERRISTNHQQNGTTVRYIPSLRRGGVIFFFHVNKAGGLSLQHNIRRHPNVNYIFAEGERTYKQITDNLEGWINGTAPYPKNTIHVMEIHSQQNPPFDYIYDDLMAWRAAFQEQLHVPFFAFTMVREPVSHLISAFNFICGQNQRCQRYRWLPNLQMNVDGLLRIAHPNLQCRYFLRQWLALSEPERHYHPPLHEECRDVYQQKMRSFFDWIGTVEKYNETLQLLESILPPANFTANFEKINETREQHKNVNRSMLNESALYFLTNITSLDKQLYDSVRRDYQFGNVVVDEIFGFSRGEDDENEE